MMIASFSRLAPEHQGNKRSNVTVGDNAYIDNCNRIGVITEQGLPILKARFVASRCAITIRSIETHYCLASTVRRDVTADDHWHQQR
jgi:hypothetical protein